MEENQIVFDQINQDFIVYPKRWWALLLFALVNISNSMMWVTFAPISDQTKHFFDNIGGNTSVNMLAVVFCIMYFPGTVLSVFTMKKYQLRGNLLIGSLLTLFGAVLRLIGAFCRKDLGAYGSYILILIGQLIIALGQPLFMNVPAALSSAWFPVNERDIATTVSSMFNPLGNAIGQIIPILFVDGNSDDDNNIHDDGDNRGLNIQMTTMLLVEAILILVSTIFVYFFFESEPPTPPSQSTKMRTAKAPVRI